MKLILILFGIRFLYMLFKRFSGKSDQTKSDKQEEQVNIPKRLLIKDDAKFHISSGTGYMDQEKNVYYFAELSERESGIFIATVYQDVEGGEFQLDFQYGQHSLKITVLEFLKLLQECGEKISSSPQSVKNSISTHDKKFMIQSGRMDQEGYYFAAVFLGTSEKKIVTLFRHIADATLFMYIPHKEGIVLLKFDKFVQGLELCRETLIESPQLNRELFGGPIDKEFMVATENALLRPETQEKLKKIMEKHQQDTKDVNDHLF